MLQLNEAKANVDLRNAFAQGLIRARKVFFYSGGNYPGGVYDEGKRRCLEGEYGLAERKAESAGPAGFC